MSVSGNLRRIIRDRGLSLKEIAQGSGIPASTISVWANGKQEPRAEALWKLANYLGVSVEFLITGRHQEERILEELVADASKRFVSIHQGTYRITVEKEIAPRQAGIPEAAVDA